MRNFVESPLEMWRDCEFFMEIRISTVYDCIFCNFFVFLYILSYSTMGWRREGKGLYPSLNRPLHHPTRFPHVIYILHLCSTYVLCFPHLPQFSTLTSYQRSRYSLILNAIQYFTLTSYQRSRYTFKDYPIYKTNSSHIYLLFTNNFLTSPPSM